MNTNTVKITPLFQKVGIDIIEFPQQDKATKLKKDGTPKILCATKRKARNQKFMLLKFLILRS